jgi:hypothetical protein
MVPGCNNLMDKATRPSDTWIEALELSELENPDGVFICRPCFQWSSKHDGKMPSAEYRERKGKTDGRGTKRKAMYDSSCGAGMLAVLWPQKQWGGL